MTLGAAQQDQLDGGVDVVVDVRRMAERYLGKEEEEEEEVEVVEEEEEEELEVDDHVIKAQLLVLRYTKLMAKVRWNHESKNQQYELRKRRGSIGLLKRGRRKHVRTSSSSSSSSGSGWLSVARRGSSGGRRLSYHSGTSSPYSSSNATSVDRRLSSLSSCTTRDVMSSSVSSSVSTNSKLSSRNQNCIIVQDDDDDDLDHNNNNDTLQMKLSDIEEPNEEESNSSSGSKSKVQAKQMNHYHMTQEQEEEGEDDEGLNYCNGDGALLQKSETPFLNTSRRGSTSCIVSSPAPVPPASTVPSSSRNSTLGMELTPIHDGFRSKWVRSWFFSKRQMKALYRCDLEHLIYLIMWYPQYATEMLVSDDPQLRALQRPICDLLLNKFFNNTQKYAASGMALDIIMWNVLKHEFTVNATIPLRSNNAAGHLLGAYGKANASKQTLLRELGPVLEQALNNQTKETSATDLATRILDKLLVTDFPPGLLSICRMIKHLTGDSPDQTIATVGSCFFFLRYVIPFIISFDGTATSRNDLFLAVARSLQQLCNYAKNEQRDTFQQVVATDPSYNYFLERNVGKLRRLILYKLCHDEDEEEVADDVDKEKVDVDHRQQQQQKNTTNMRQMELGLDVERILTKHQYTETHTPNAVTSSGASSIYLSAYDITSLVKAVLILAENHPNDTERNALQRYTEPLSFHLQALANDPTYIHIGENPYLELKPLFFPAPPLCAKHTIPSKYATQLNSNQTEHQIVQNLQQIKPFIY